MTVHGNGNRSEYGGKSNYFGCDYRQIQPCPHCVAEAGMEIFLQIKHLLRRARKEKKNAIARSMVDVLEGRQALGKPNESEAAR